MFRLLETMETVSSVAACRHMTDEGFAELQSLLVDMDSLVDDPASPAQPLINSSIGTDL